MNNRTGPMVNQVKKLKLAWHFGMSLITAKLLQIMISVFSILIFSSATLRGKHIGCGLLLTTEVRSSNPDIGIF